MDIMIVSKPGCPRCLLAKDKLNRMGFSFREVAVEDAEIEVQDIEFPVLLLDGIRHTYPSAMARLKELKNARSV